MRGTLTGSLTYGRGIWRTDVGDSGAGGDRVLLPELGGGYGVAVLVVGVLIEKKTVFDPAAAMDNWLNQVLAYVLLHLGDALGVDTISAYLGRQALGAEPSLVVLASAPSRNNPVRGVCYLLARRARCRGLGLRREPPNPPPEQMAKVSRFLGDGEVTSL